ncbi:MAG: hypothetical protein RR922_02420 [Clostridia bacterium]
MKNIINTVKNFIGGFTKKTGAERDTFIMNVVLGAVMLVAMLISYLYIQSYNANNFATSAPAYLNMDGKKIYLGTRALKFENFFVPILLTSGVAVFAIKFRAKLRPFFAGFEKRIKDGIAADKEVRKQKENETIESLESNEILKSNEIRNNNENKPNKNKY